MSTGKGGPPGAETEGSERRPAPHTQPCRGDGLHITALQGPCGAHPTPGQQAPQAVCVGTDGPAEHAQQDKTGRSRCPSSRGKGTALPRPLALAALYLGGDVGDGASKAVLSDGAVGAVGGAGARAGRAVAHGRHYGKVAAFSRARPEPPAACAPGPSEQGRQRSPYPQARHL